MATSMSLSITLFMAHPDATTSDKPTKVTNINHGSISPRAASKKPPATLIKFPIIIPGLVTAK
jgi:hypothetical protein